MLEHLQPGDILLYSGKSLLSWLIKVKTWSRYSHSEIYLGDGLTASSREGHGVNIYKFTPQNLCTVLRPKIPPNCKLDLAEALSFHASCIGQPYDTLGLLRFFRIGKETVRTSFCSEHCTRVTRKIKILDEFDQFVDYFQPFAQHYDADLVSPGMFFASPHYDVISLSGD